MDPRRLNLEGTKTLEEALYAVKAFVERYTGWADLEVKFNYHKLEMEIREPTNAQYGGLLLKLELTTWFEVYGRTRNVGFTRDDLHQLNHILALVRPE